MEATHAQGTWRIIAEAEERIEKLEKALQNLRRAAVWMYGELQPNFPLREKCAAAIRAAESLLPRGEEWGSDEKTEQEGTGIIEGLQDALLSEYMRPCDERP